MKWDAVRLERQVPGSDDLARELGIDRSKPLVVGGSTAGDEEALLHRACPPGVQLLCAPRKPEHFAAAAAALPGCTRRSGASATPSSNPHGRFLLDTIGELRKAYALADVVVIGRSFGDLYGSDPIEPAALGTPVIIGPRFGDFQTIVDTLHRAGGIVLADREDLAGAIARLISDREASARVVDAARACVLRHQGASARHAELLLSRLASRAPDSTLRE
jgi:3-deoxy-D-manno-octulosonic-acid transferase